MSFIPKLARQLQSFESVEDMNRHMNLHYLTLKDVMTCSYDQVFHILKKYSCRVAGVCWLKQETIALHANVSIKTVERTINFLKKAGIIKVYHTKRGNGLNGNCYYVLQPYTGELLMDDEEIAEVDEGDNVGAVEFILTYETPAFKLTQTQDKLFLNSYKALKNSLKPFEEIIISAREQSNINIYKTLDNKALKERKKQFEEEYRVVIEHLIDNHFSEKAAKKIVSEVNKRHAIEPGKLLIFCAKALRAFHKRLAYPTPITSVTALFIAILQNEIEPEYQHNQSTKKDSAVSPDFLFYNWLEA